jgi:hypothetical protein
MNIYYLNLAQSHTGLCNQIFSLFATIIYAINNKINIIVVDKFLREINTNNYDLISNIFDLDKLNNLLKDYNVIVIDNYVQNFKIKKVTYGFNEINNDITELFNIIKKENIIQISNKDNLNNLFNGDPLPFHKKILHINLEPSYEIIIGEENGYLIENLELDLNNILKSDNFMMTPNWSILKENITISNFLFNNIFFTTKFINIKNDFFNKYKQFSKINIIHLRLESDIEFWASINNMSYNDFYIKLSNIYINLIKEHIDSNDLTIILGYNLNNDVIEYLKKYNYNYQLVEKNSSFLREENAIIDLLIGFECNNILIGVSGSTFSLIIDNVIKNNKSILININDLNFGSYILNK